MTKDIHSISHKIIASALSGLMLLSSTSLVFAQSNQPRPTAQEMAAADQSDDGVDWPRTFSDSNLDYTLYQPQIDSWTGDKIEARAAIAVKAAGSAQSKYGVAWFIAKTLIDRQSDTVQLTDVEVTKVSFPSDTAASDNYAAVLRQHVRATIPDVSLASLQSALAVSEAEKGNKAVELRNDPPYIYYSEKPAFLIRIDGKPVLREVSGSKLLRVINTPSLVVFEEQSATYYLRAFKHWYATKSLDSGANPGNWTRVEKPPAALASVLKAAGASAAAFDAAPPAIADVVNAGGDPVFYVATAPAELLQTAGEPEILPVPDTKLLYVKNTSSQMLIDEDSQSYYVLISGRWFKSSALTGADWSYVANDDLPADFAKIPENHPKGAVLASVSGTPQAKESLIDNAIPQMAEVDRSKATFKLQLDGPVQMKAIEGTNMQYVVNSAAPVIETSDGHFYAVANGVWFASGTLDGPWAVASSVPPEIYSIPSSSPLHYITYVHIYGATPKEVYVGYTPGYYGTAVSKSGTVVYGTGYSHTSWTANNWYPAPATYGAGESFLWGAATGFIFGAVATAAWSGGAWGAWGWHGWGGWGNNTVIINNFNHFNQFNFNNANIYNRWQNNAVHTQFRNQINNRVDGRLGNRVNNAQGRFTPEQRQNVANQARDRAGNLSGQQRQNLRNAAQAHPRGSNNLFAGHDGHVYRRGAGGWEQHVNGGWNRNGNGNASIGNRLNADQAARSRGNAMGGIRGGGNFGRGFHGGGGFHGRGGGFHGGFRR